MAVLTKSQEGVEEGKPTKDGTLRAKKYNRREALAGYFFISPGSSVSWSSPWAP